MPLEGEIQRLLVGEWQFLKNYKKDPAPRGEPEAAREPFKQTYAPAKKFLVGDKVQYKYPKYNDSHLYTIFGISVVVQPISYWIKRVDGTIGETLVPEYELELVYGL